MPDTGIQNVISKQDSLSHCKDRLIQADVLIVGAGFYGATIAENLASNGCRVVIIDRRHHIGGNAYSSFDSETGIEVHEYGPHLFHTSNKVVWDYVQRFSAFTSHQLRVFTQYAGQVYPMPINLATMCQFFGRVLSPTEAQALIRSQAKEMDGHTPRNLEEKAISLVGRPLYEAFIRGYTLKQWQRDPRDLPESIITRLPVRYDFNTRYFNDFYEGLPQDGYTALFDRMLDHPNISVHLGVDYFELKPDVPEALITVYSGPIDRYFSYSEGALGWRSLKFEKSILPVESWQGTGAMNYSDESVPWTRIIEYRHFHPERQYTKDKTVIVKEFPMAAGPSADPYYPVGTLEDAKRYLSYRARAEAERNVIFGGRLGSYRYLDMHQAIASALKDSTMITERLRARGQ